MKVYKCDGKLNDGSSCNETSDNTESWLTIGSHDNKSLFAENNLENRCLVQMGRHSDIHFCSKQCFINRFFQPETPGHAKPKD